MIARALRQLAAVLALALLPALVSGAIQLRWNSEEPVADGEIKLETVKNWGDHVLWVDARSKTKFDEEHIPGALPLTEDEWNAQIAHFLDAWDPDIPVVVYCDGGTCELSKAVADRLRRELKIEKVFVLKGGWSAWQKR